MSDVVFTKKGRSFAGTSTTQLSVVDSSEISRVQVQSKYTGRTSYDACIRPVVIDLIERQVFKNDTYQDIKAQIVLKTMNLDPQNPPPGFSISTIKTIFRQEWSKRVS